jgi:hypothetical protein
MGDAIDSVGGGRGSGRCLALLKVYHRALEQLDCGRLGPTVDGDLAMGDAVESVGGGGRRGRRLSLLKVYHSIVSILG